MERIADQIRQNAMDENSAHASNLSKIASVFARTFSLMGNFRFPLCASETQAEEWFDIWRMINEQRMVRHAWSFVGPDAEQKFLYPTILAFRSIAERNQARSRRRYL